MESKQKCSICGGNLVPDFYSELCEPIDEDDYLILNGNSPQPVVKDGKMLKITDRCCDDCNYKIVLPIRNIYPNWRKPLRFQTNDPDSPDYINPDTIIWK